MFLIYSQNIKIIGPYKEEIWIPKHCTCNITIGRQLCPKTFGGLCISVIITFQPHILKLVSLFPKARGYPFTFKIPKI